MNGFTLVDINEYFEEDNSNEISIILTILIKENLRQCGQKWLVILLFLSLNFVYQPEEEAGSAEEQPTSNKVDAKR